MSLQLRSQFFRKPAPLPAEHEVQIRSNLLRECVFNVMNGIFAGMIFYASPVVAKTSLAAKGWHIAIILCAFPCGAFLAPVWARLARKWGLQGMVLRMAVAGNAPLFLVPFVGLQPWVSPATAFSLLMMVSLLVYSAMKMGQSSLYRSTYPANVRGRILGWLLLCNYLTMVPTTLLAGWLIDHPFDPANYRWLYPLTAVMGLSGCLAYARVRPLEEPHLGEPVSLLGSLRQAADVLWRDKDFRWFQLGFFLNGSAFFMSIGVVLELVKAQGFGATELAIVMGALPLSILGICSPVWGRVLDGIGIVWMRVLVAIVMTLYLSCYFTGILFALPAFIYLGSLLRGISESGGQVTWQLASVQFAPTTAEVPVYNSIHFTLNGIRGLLMPWVGLTLLGYIGPWTVAVAILVSACSIFTGMNLVRRTSVELEPPALAEQQP